MTLDRSTLVTIHRCWRHPSWCFGTLLLFAAGCVGDDGAQQDTGSGSASGTTAASNTTDPEDTTGGNDQGGDSDTSGNEITGTTADGDDDADSGSSTGPAGPADDCVALVEAATAFVGALDATQQGEALFGFDDAERTRFEFLPPNSAARAGLTMRDIDAAQAGLLADMLMAALSANGYAKEEDIRQLESVLAMAESGQPVTDNRDPNNYFISIFGTPNVDAGTPWAWRFEGHHMSLHGSMLDCEQFASTPAFWGASPQLDPLQAELDAEQALWDALDGDQQGQASVAVSANAVDDKIGTIDPLATEGIPGGSLTAAQVDLLRALVLAYAEAAMESAAQARMDRIDADGFADVYYARDPGSGNFRVLGPSFLIELVYAGGDHVHAVWRDYTGDYGEDLIAAHVHHHPH